MSLCRSSWTTRWAALAGLAVMAFASPAAAQTPITLRLDWLASGYQAPFFLAQQKGWFKKYGLDVKIEQGTGSASTSALVGAGQYDVGFAGLSNMAFARDKGMPLTSIAGLLRKIDVALLVPVDSPIKTVVDMKGKKFVYTAASIEAPFLDAFLAYGKLKKSDMTFDVVDAAAKMPTYLATPVDGVFSTVSYTLGIVEAKKKSRAILYADNGLDLPGYGLLTTADKLKAKGDAIKKFASVVAGAFAYVHSGHQDEALKALIDTYPQDRLDMTILRTQLKDSETFLTTEASKSLPPGAQADADWAKGVKILEEAQTIKSGSKAAEYYTNDYLDQDIVKSVMAGS